MIEVEVSDAEVTSGQLDKENLETAVEAIHEDGYVVLHDSVDLDHVDRIHGKMEENYHEIVESDRDHQLVKDNNDPDPFREWATANRGNQQPPYEMEYLFEDIVQNVLAAQVMEEVIGGQVMAGTYSSNVSLPGCGEQPLHWDLGPREPDDEVGGPCENIVMNIPLSDFTFENGATEMWPGTQFVPPKIGSRRLTAEQRAERIKEGHPPERAVMPRGSVLLRDMRTWHRGPANNTDVYRPMLSQIFFQEIDEGFDSLHPIGPFPPEAQSLFEDGPIVYNAQFSESPGETSQ